tara:strand:- start:105 stop:2594 length:2490 start_codon:yes stop_codon:yes gene_type:complete
MKKYLLLSFVFLISFSVNAQFGGFGGGAPKIKGKISGSVIDSISGAAVGFASISIKRKGSKKILNGTLSEDDGKFSFTDITPGKYEMEITFLGYADKLISAIETTKKSPDNNLGALYIIPSDILLDEIEITEKRALIENKVDRIVFNAEDDSSISGGDATDVLRKVPNLSVDLDGNVSIRGSQNIKILMNGKPSGMFSNNVADALKMFPADQIKKVEVITSPGAKYDAEGSGGLINIITKKAEISGIAGSVNASVGNRQNNSFVNLNAGKGRFGSTINGAVFYSVPQDGDLIFRRTDRINGSDRTLTQDGVRETQRLGFNGSASAFYDINAYNAINTSFSTRGFGFDVNGDINGELISPNSAENFSFVRDQVDDNINDGFDWNTDYTRKFEGNETQELVIAYQLSKNNQDQEINILETNTFEFFNRDEFIFNDSDNFEHTGQLDYTHPISKKITLETGAKTVIRDIKSDYQYSTRAFGTTGDYSLDANRSNIFNYDQNVMAGYGQLKFPVGKLLLITGLRYERTEIAGADDKNELGFENSYDNYIPNFTISRALKNFRNLKLSYSKRIQRPSLRFINPFNNTTDRTNVVIGNPTLAPEITHQIEVGYNTRVVGFNIFGSGYFKKTNDIIEQILIVQPSGVSLNTFDNVGTNNSVGLNLFINKSIKKLNFRIGGDVFTYNGEGQINGEQLSNSALQYQIFTGGDYAISSTWKADFFGFFRSDQPTLQGSTPSFSIMGIGIRKDLKDWSIGLRVIEPFSENKSFVSDQEGENFSQFTSFQLPFRSIGLNVRYKFGKVDFKERRSKIRNTDQKSGDDGQGGGNQGGSGPPRG